tara:strand:- start:681 stop:821 length:141 start_codon:yes stop_codon:yes gene_type:complete
MEEQKKALQKLEKRLENLQKSLCPWRILGEYIILLTIGLTISYNFL